MFYDPWQSAITKNGYPCDEVISALQKCIRRGLEEEACMFAYELYLTSPELEDKLWSRLLTISVEDVGMGNPMASVIMNNLNQMRREFDYQAVDREGLLKQLGIDMILIESVLEDEGMHVFEWWGGEYRPLEELIAEMDEVKQKNK